MRPPEGLWLHWSSTETALAEAITSISRHTPPALTIDSGSSLELRVEDWCFGRLGANSATYGAMARPRCPVAGPVDVRGAEIGDHLAINIEQITVDARGTAARISEVGPLAPGDGQTKVWDVRCDGDAAIVAGLSFAIAPMIGIIGVRPQSDEEIGTRYTGVYGGNLDTREITTGAQVELPVLTDGGGVFVGDLHAAMGDGEMTATGCEVGGFVRMRINLVKHQQIPGPRLRFGSSWATLATSRDFREATTTAARAMHDWIRAERGLAEDAAAFVVGMAGDLGVSQVVNPSGVTVKVVVDWDRVRA